MSTEHPFSQWINLAQPRLGARVIMATDDFFAPKERLIQPAAPQFDPDLYDNHGKWMDGWESRRRRDGGHDYCIVRLGSPGIIQGFDINSTHFTGNYPPEVAIEACLSENPDEAQWTELVPRQSIEGDSHNFVEIDDLRAWNHFKLHIFPDGGIARLRIFGQVRRQWQDEDFESEHDLAAIENGGRAIACNDMFYGDVANLISPGAALNMGDGWETRRRREPGHDWAILALGHAGCIHRVVVDTSHFKGNYPDRCSLEGALVKPDADPDEPLSWRTLMSEQPLRPHTNQLFDHQLIDHEPVNLVRLNIFPDGGIARLRLIGRPVRELS
jgi:allantoicase